MASGKEYSMLFKLSAELGSSFNSSFNSAKTPVLGLQNEINKLNKAQADISAYTKQQGAVDSTSRKLEMLKTQYDNIQREMTETGNSSADMKNKLIAKQNQIDRTSESLKGQTDKLNTLGSALDKAGIDTKDLAAESKRLDTQIDELKGSQEDAARAAGEFGTKTADAVNNLQSILVATGIVAGVKQLADGLKASAEAAIEFESAMAGVSKTSDMSNEELAAMADEFQRMSTNIPVSANELASIAETAGQLGVAKDDLASFTEVMAKLSTATTMSAEEGATMLAQLANITQMDPKDYERLASTVVDLGNNFATTEQKILDMSQGMAAAANLAGMSEADITGLSAAISSLGIESQAGATSASKLITELDKAVQTGDNLSEFARVAGMTGADFAKAWGEDAAGALALFITGLNDTERNGKSATLILEELGITEVRMQRMMLSLAGSGDLLNRALETSNQAWRDNTALQVEADKRYQTTESKIKMARNAFENLKVTIGEQLTPVIGQLADAFNRIISGITEWMEKNPELTQAILTGIGIFAAGAAGIGVYTAAVNAAKIAMAAMKLAIPGVGWVAGGLAALALLGGAFVLLKAELDRSVETFEELDTAYGGLMGSIQEDNQTLELIDEYKSLRAELDAGGLSAKDLAAKQERLAEVKQLLVDRSGGLITATDKETGAFDRQVEALETIVQMQRDEARAKAYENLTKQSKLYAEALKTEQENTQYLTAAQEKQNEVVGIIGGGYDEAITKAKDLGDAMSTLWDDESLTDEQKWIRHNELVKEASDLMSILLGEQVDYSGNPVNFFFDLENLDEGSTKFRQSWQDANDQVSKYQGAVFAAQQTQDTFLQNLVDGVTVGGIALSEYETMLTETFSGYENGAQIVADIMAYVAQATQAAAGATDMGAAMQTTAEQTLVLQTTVDATKAKMDELSAAYTKVYDSALASVNGQIKLFTELKKPETTLTSDQMLKTLNEQAGYLDSYNANLQKAVELGVAPELVKQLSDGSVENATYLQTIVTTSETKIAEINAAFAKVSEGKEAFAATIAEMQTNFTSAMDELQSQLVADVAAMDLNADAAASGKATIQGLINGASGMLGAVQIAYGKIARAAAAALKVELDIESPSKVTTEIGMYTGMGLIEGALSQERGFSQAMGDMAQAGMDAYWNSGLIDALGPGTFLRDGRIFVQPAQQSTLTARSSPPIISTMSLNVAPVYNISSNERPDAIRGALSQHDRGLRAMVLDIVSEAEFDQKRRRYDG